MNMMQLLRSAEATKAQLSTTNLTTTNDDRAAKRAAGIAKVERILADATLDPERFINVVRAQMAREERQLFTYRQVAYKAAQGDEGAMTLIEEFFRQERGDNMLTEEEVSDAQLEQLWEAGISLGRILSCDPVKLSSWYQGRGKEGSKPYAAVTHWARAVGYCRRNGLDAVANTVEQLMKHFYLRFFPQPSMETAQDLQALVLEYENYHPGFADCWANAHQ